MSSMGSSSLHPQFVTCPERFREMSSKVMPKEIMFSSGHLIGDQPQKKQYKLMDLFFRLLTTTLYSYMPTLFRDKPRICQAVGYHHSNNTKMCCLGCLQFRYSQDSLAETFYHSVLETNFPAPKHQRTQRTQEPNLKVMFTLHHWPLWSTGIAHPIISSRNLKQQRSII